MEIKKYVIKPITKNVERAFLARWHYSKKAVPNSNVLLGCFYNQKIVGTISFGKIINCVPIFKNEPNTSGLELNRLAMIDEAPKNSESWFLMHSVKILKKNYPWLKFVHTWGDGLRCQGGTIYKACGFHYLRKIPILSQFQLPDGSVIHSIAFNKTYLKKYYKDLKGIKTEIERVRKIFGKEAKEVTGGFNYHYVYLVDKSLYNDFSIEPIPYEKNTKT